MTWFSRIRSASSTPDGDTVRDDIVEFHTAHPGITEAVLGALTSASGLTGYALLRARIPDGASAALDLGPASGFADTMRVDDFVLVAGIARLELPFAIVSLERNAL